MRRTEHKALRFALYFNLPEVPQVISWKSLRQDKRKACLKFEHVFVVVVFGQPTKVTLQEVLQKQLKVMGGSYMFQL